MANNHLPIEWAEMTEVPRPREKHVKKQFLSIPNNLVGRTFLYLLRRWANRSTYRIVVRGRTPRWYVAPWNRFARWLINRDQQFVLVQWARKRWSDGTLFINCNFSVPLKHSSRLGVYFEPRKPRTRR